MYYPYYVASFAESEYTRHVRFVLFQRFLLRNTRSLRFPPSSVKQDTTRAAGARRIVLVTRSADSAVKECLLLKLKMRVTDQVCIFI